MPGVATSPELSKFRVSAHDDLPELDALSLA